MSWLLAANPLQQMNHSGDQPGTSPQAVDKIRTAIAAADDQKAQQSYQGTWGKTGHDLSFAKLILFVEVIQAILSVAREC